MIPKWIRYVLFWLVFNSFVIYSLDEFHYRQLRHQLLGLENYSRVQMMAELASVEVGKFSACETERIKVTTQYSNLLDSMNNMCPCSTSKKRRQ